MPIVTATAAFSGSKDRNLAKRIEAAMAGAALMAHAEGVVDPARVKVLMLAARERAKDESSP